MPACFYRMFFGDLCSKRHRWADPPSREKSSRTGLVRVASSQGNTRGPWCVGGRYTRLKVDDAIPFVWVKDMTKPMREMWHPLYPTVRSTMDS